jgi:hypothetical protein
MPRIKKNYFFQGASGDMNGQFVYKQRGGRLFAAAMPDVKPNREFSADQIKVRKRFKLASLYAQGIMNDVAIKKQYQKKAEKHQSAYNVAFQDYMKAPVVESIDSAAYTGIVGSKIIVEATDDFRVTEVKVGIYSSSGSVIEEGQAVLNPMNLGQWIYTVLQANASLAGTTITAIASDLPGNEGTLEVVL